MAFSVIRKDSAPGFDNLGCYTEYACDERADVATLPTGVGVTDRQLKPRGGSMAVCAEPPSLYMLTPSRAWKKLWEAEE